MPFPGWFTIVPFHERHTAELVSMWRASFERAVGVRDPHPIEEQTRFLLGDVVPNNDVRVALADGRVVGFIAAKRDSISQLYLHVDYQGRGLGTHLLDWAKARSGGSLWLYTFENNTGAQRFYESHGFVVTQRGFEPEWKLRDLRYEWRRDASGEDPADRDREAGE